MGELASLKAAHGQHAKEVEGVKGAHAKHASLGERVDYIEKLCGDSADKHADELAALKAAHSKHADELAKHAKAHSGHANDKDALESFHGTLKERVDYLEGLLG